MRLGSCAGQLAGSLSLSYTLLSFSHERLLRLPLISVSFQSRHNFLRFLDDSLLKSCTFKIHVFPEVTPCHSPNCSRRAEQQGHGILGAMSSKRRQIVTRQHGVTSNVELLQVEFIAPHMKGYYHRYHHTVSITFLVHTHCTNKLPCCL